MHIGRFQLGRRVPLSVRAVDSSSTPALPTAVPTAKIVRLDTNTLVVTHSIPIKERYVITGLFQFDLLLTSAYSAGDYGVTFDWTISGTAYSKEQQFTVVVGGDAAGQIIGLSYLTRPNADHVVFACDGGTIQDGRNPQ